MGRANAFRPAALALALALGAPAGAAPDKVPAVNLFEDASDLTAQLRKAIAGRIMIHELTMYESSASLDIQDPQRKENLDRYSYRDGKMKPPEPIKLSGDYTQADLDAAGFPLESVNFGLIPTMIQDAKTRLKMPDGSVGSITLKRNWPFSDDVLWHVSVKDVRHMGSVEYDLKGKKKSVWKE